MEYKTVLPTVKLKINDGKLDQNMKNLKKFGEDLNKQKGKFRLLIKYNSGTDAIQNFIFTYIDSELLKDVKFLTGGPTYNCILSILFKFDLDYLSIYFMSPMTCVFLMYSLSGEKSNIFNDEEFRQFFNNYDDFLKWMDRDVQQKMSKLRKLKIKDTQIFPKNHDFFITLIISVINTNPLLVSIKLPDKLKDDVSILAAMNKNHTLLETNSYADPKVLERNNKLYKQTKKLVITFLALRSKGFKLIDKNLFEKIAKLIFEFRHDIEHLKALEK